MRHSVPNIARLFTGLLLALFMTVAGAGSVWAQQASAEELVGKLQSGGYNVYVRHAATDWSQKDSIGGRDDIASCDGTKVRQLSAKGREDARKTGVALKALGISFASVYSSPYCRSVETARLMSDKEPETTDDLMNLRSSSYAGGRETVVERARARLSQPPAQDGNALHSAHGNLGNAATGEYLKEGELLVVKPTGEGRFGIEGRLSLTDLETLAGR